MKFDNTEIFNKSINIYPKVKSTIKNYFTFESNYTFVFTTF